MHRGVLTSGTADQLATLVARAAHAPGAMIHFREGATLRLYGAWGLSPAGAEVAELPLTGSLTGLVATGGRPLVIDEVATDDRVPADSPLRSSGWRGGYLGQPVTDHDGRVIGVCCAFDPAPRAWTSAEVAAVAEAAQVCTLLISERLARREVDRQRRFQDAVLDSLHDGVAAVDAEGRVVLVNTRMKEIWADTGLPTRIGADEPIDGLFDGAGTPLRHGEAGLFRAMRGESLRDEPLVLRKPGRRTRHYLVDAHPITDADGGTHGAVMAVRDVTRRRRVERFRTCELGVTTALNGAPCLRAAGPRVLEAVIGTLDWAHAELWLADDAAGVIRPAARFSAPGVAADIAVPDELPYGRGLAGRAWQVGKPLWIRDVGRPQSLISRATAEGARLHTALAIPVRNGNASLGVLTLFAESIEDPEGEVVALLSGIAAHIGQFLERQQVEDLQRQLTRSKNEYLALVGHELRTPLTAISAYTEILRDLQGDALAADGPALLEVIDRNTAQLRHIIDELMELSALDTGHAPVAMAPVDLAEVVRESVERTRVAINGSPVELSADLPAELVVPGDRRRLGQIVDNLLGNAVKYSPDGGRISVCLRPAGRTAELTVSDTGLGVAPEEREKLFTRMYRSSMVRDRAIPGTGLGLALSRAVVQRHHGTIELADHEGPGTTVRVQLPLDPP
jgi:signal transduction histidine kinase/PAS domain-containing protein